MTIILAGLGMMLVIEGLILSFLPGRLDEIVRFLADMPVEKRRTIGLVAVAAGVGLVQMASF